MKRKLLPCPEGFKSWQAYWLDQIMLGARCVDLTRKGYCEEDIRHLTRRHALERGLELPAELAWRRRPKDS